MDSVVRLRTTSRSNNSRVLDENENLYMLLIENLEEVRCPTCDTPNEVPGNRDLERCTCKECGQNLGQDPNDRFVEREW